MPDPLFELFESYEDELQGRNRTRRWKDKIKIKAEREAFLEMAGEISRMRNKRVKSILTDYLKEFLNDGALMTYVLNESWNDKKNAAKKEVRNEIRRKKNIEAKSPPLSLMIELESIFATRHDSNRRSNPGDPNFKSSRYPLSIGSKKFRGTLTNVDPYLFYHSVYVFGSHEFQVGKALFDALNFLEKRYELDFSALESALMKDEGPL